MQIVELILHRGLAGLSVEGQGFHGSACTLPLTQIVSALGGDPAQLEPTPEHYLVQDQGQEQNIAQ